MSFIATFEKYLNQLEDIADEHDELTDTDVRERLYEVINWYFIWGHPIDKHFPRKYAMFSEVGDRLVEKVTRAFIEAANKEAADVSVGESRHALIENSEIETKLGETYDLYLGSSDEVLPAERPVSDKLYGDYD